MFRVKLVQKIKTYFIPNEFFFEDGTVYEKT